MICKSTILVIGLTILSSVAVGDDWPQWRGPGRDGVWSETGLLKTFPDKQVKVLWRAKIGPGYSGPTVADGRVYITDRHDEGPTTERVHCLEAKTGKSIWTHSYRCNYRVGYPLGPRASVSVDDGLAYVLGAMGHFHCLNAKTGEVVWKNDLAKTYRTRRILWGFSAAPLVYGDLVILHIGGAGKACLVALDKKTGARKWTAIDDGMTYSAPIIVKRGDNDVLVCWTKNSLSGLDPKTGKVHWQVPYKIMMSWQMASITPLVEGDNVYVSACYDGSMLVKMSPDGLKARKVWRSRGVAYGKTKALQCVHSTPVVFGGHIYGFDSRGEMRCIKTATGARVWENLTVTPRGVKWGTAHMVQNVQTTWIFNEQGEVIIAKLSPKGFKQIARAQLIEPTHPMSGRKVCWSHPAFANRCIYARNDREIVCGDLSAK
ncbi:MAG: PQQ-binding-like beta-propeller repeat protein [Phycisphaerales bacterium]|nr:PQQ-binding-like beta-propeller repeat protein [Phycisphaerales bacterium]